MNFDDIEYAVDGHVARVTAKRLDLFGQLVNPGLVHLLEALTLLDQRLEQTAALFTGQRQGAEAREPDFMSRLLDLREPAGLALLDCHKSSLCRAD